MSVPEARPVEQKASTCRVKAKNLLTSKQPKTRRVEQKASTRREQQILEIQPKNNLTPQNDSKQSLNIFKT